MTDPAILDMKSRRRVNSAVRRHRSTNMASAIVVISSDPPTLNTTSGAGAQTSPQITSAIVTLENESSQEHVSIWLPVDDSTDLQQGLKASHPDAIVSIVNNNGDGACNCSTDAHANPFSVAAALAVVKRSWGWDETTPMLVRVNGIELRVHARYDGNAWIATDA